MRSHNKRQLPSPTQRLTRSQPICPALPSAPQGKSTLIGGEIRKVDAVRDQFTLAVFGGRPIKILFDARTQLYRDGIKLSPGDLHPGERASVETCWMKQTSLLSASVCGPAHPRVISKARCCVYNPGTGELTISGTLSHEPIKLLVPAGTPVLRDEQAAFSSAPSGSSDLVAGALISIKFESNHQGQGVATQITILATPGSTFVFNGNVSFLDLQSGRLVLVNVRDDKSYQIVFDPARFPMSRHLHQGDRVTVTANFDGARYVACSMTVS